MAIELVGLKDAVLIPVKVVPGASKTRIMGELDGRLKVAVSAAPEQGKANDALTSFLAGQLGVRRRAVTVDRGPTSPLKTVRVEGVSAVQVREALSL
ncbi:MAG: DUF167 domain-containing protein [bacterium]|nr:DUF167 domain-containing protein [bacterium]